MHQARRPARDNREANPVMIKPAAASHVDSSSWGSLNCCSPPRRPFPRKSFALLACVSSWKVHFWVLGKSPLSGPRKGVPPVLQQNQKPDFNPLGRPFPLLCCLRSCQSTSLSKTCQPFCASGKRDVLPDCKFPSLISLPTIHPAPEETFTEAANK